MLPLFRKKREWLKWTLLLVILALGFTTVLLFVDTPGGITSGVGMQDVASVAGETVSASEFRRQYLQMIEIYREIYNLDRQSPEMIKQLGIGQQTLNNLISQYAVVHEAQNLGLTVSDEELIQQISSIGAFQEDGRFIGSERYRQLLQSNNLTPQQFEAATRRSLLNQKFRKLMTDGIEATPDEIRQNFVETNQEVKLRYVMYDPEEMEVGEVPDESLQEYYDEHLEDFAVEEQRRIQYVVAQIKPSEIEVTAEQVTAELPNVPNQEQVRARHILKRSDPDPETARKEIEQLLSQIQGGADFAELARQHSDDTVSAAQGGDLGFFGRGRMVPQFEQVAFDLEPGQTSGIVETPFGFHIIQTVEKVTDTEEARRPVAEFKAREAKADGLSSELAEKILTAVKSGATLEDAAAEHSLEVIVSPYFTSSSTVPGAGVGMDFTQAIFSLEAGELAEPYSSVGKHIVAKLDDIKPARIPEFEEIRDQVKEEYDQEEGIDLAREKAFEFFHAATAEDFTELAGSEKLAVTTTEFFRRNTSIDDNLKFSPDIHEQAFGLETGKVGSPVEVDGKFIVFQVVEKSEIDEEKFEQEKAQLQESLTLQKRAEFYNAYVQNVVSELRRNEQIIVNQQLLDNLTS
jgi:peptidyl-prolyl cis-trans isomerase D